MEAMNFLPADSLNCEIISVSLSLQCEISKSNKPEGPQIGAQQAMPAQKHVVDFGPDNPLPWVPDRIGKTFSHQDNGVLVVGSSYNGFIEGYSQRIMALADYLHIRDLIREDKVPEACRLFITEFERQIMTPDRCVYYGPILNCLIQNAGVSRDRVCLTDLCKASFVMKGETHNDGTRLDVGNDGIVRKHWELWVKFLECGANRNNGVPLPYKWIWERMKQCRHIVALGTIAEYGVIKVFRQMSESAQVTTRNGGGNRLNRSSNRDALWKYCYADSSRKLSHWLDTNNWWILSDGAIDKRWNLLPVYHPAARPPHADLEYARSAPVLKQMCDE